jgi:hypothetical protein
LNGGEYEKLSGNNGEIRNLTACKYFRTRELKLNGKYAEKNDKTFTAINFVAGSGEINGEKFVSGDSFFIPCGEEFTVNGKATAILTTENTLKYYAGIDLGGTGVGSGIVFNGKLFEGNLGAGVELGHEVIKIGGGNCPFGYKFVKSGVITKKGRELVKLEIVPEEIEIVKYIFEKTVYDGYGTFRLSEEMNRRGIKTHAGAKFQPHSINRILRNKVYLGIFERGGKRSPVNESIRIITEKEYDEAQRIMAQRTNRA